MISISYPNYRRDCRHEFHSNMINWGRTFPQAEFAFLPAMNDTIEGLACANPRIHVQTLLCKSCVSDCPSLLNCQREHGFRRVVIVDLKVLLISKTKPILIGTHRALLSVHHHPALTTLQRNFPHRQNATPHLDASYTPEYPGDGLSQHTQQKTSGTLISNPTHHGQRTFTTATKCVSRQARPSHHPTSSMSASSKSRSPSFI